MFLQILVTLAVCVAFLSASSVQHADTHGTILDFDTLNVPVNNELGQRLMKAAKNHRPEVNADHSHESLAKAAASAKLSKDHHVKKELTASAGVPGLVTMLTTLNADCSGTHLSARYDTQVTGCSTTAFDGISQRYVCAANGDRILQTFTANNCPSDSLFSEDVSTPAVPCKMDVNSYEQNNKVFQMTNTRCLAGTTPTYAGVRTISYSTDACTAGTETATSFQLLNACTFNWDDEDNTYYYTKMVGCSSDGSGVNMVMFTDRNCFHPVQKGTMSLGETAGQCEGRTKTICHVPTAP